MIQMRGAVGRSHRAGRGLVERMAANACVRIPARLRPSWCEVPRLAWTMARADAPRAGTVNAALAGWLVYAPIIVGAHTASRLASLDT